MSYQDTITGPLQYADPFQFKFSSCNFESIQVSESAVDDSAGFSVNTTINGVTSLRTYTPLEYYDYDANYDQENQSLWPDPNKQQVITKIEDGGETINSIHNAQVPYEWTTLAGIAKGDSISPGGVLNGKIATSEALAYKIYWNMYGFGGLSIFLDNSYTGDIYVEATQTIDGESEEISFTYTRDDYYSDVAEYDPEDTETYPQPTPPEMVDKIEEDPNIVVGLYSAPGGLVRSYSPIRTWELSVDLDGNPILDENGNKVYTLTNDQPRKRLCGIPAQDTGRPEFYTPYISTNPSIVRVYFGSTYVGMALGELESLSPSTSPIGLEAGQLALVDSLVGMGGYIMTNRADTLNNRLYDLQYNKISTVGGLKDSDVIVEASAQTVLDDGGSYVDAENFRAGSRTTFGDGSESDVEFDPLSLRFWQYQ